MKRVAAALLLALAGCRNMTADELPSGAVPTVTGIVTVAAQTREVADTVRAFGTVVGEREPAEVRDARAQLAETEARMTLAAAQVARLEELTRKGVAPRKELEVAEAERATATAGVERARAAAAAFGSATPRNALAADEAWVMAEVLQDDVAPLRAGDAALFALDAGAGEVLSGRVEAAPGYVSTTTRTAPVRLRVVDAARLLRPGMTGTVSITVGAPRVAVVVPTGAILRVGVASVAVVEERPGRFAPLPVEPGVTTGDWTEVRSGVGAGTHVVTTGAASVLSAARLAGDRGG